MKIRLFFLLITFLISFILFVFFKSLFENNQYVPKKISNKIENISFKEFDSNNTIYLKDLFDKDYIILNIWSSWCVPCRQEHQYLKNLSATEDFKMVGLNYKDKKMNAEKFLNELGNPYDIIIKDLNGTKSIYLGAYGVPETFVIDSQMKIIKKYIGPLNSEIETEIKNILK